MRKLLSLLTIIICVCFTSACFAMTHEEIRALEERAIKGEAEAQIALGNIYVQGKDIEQDYSKAFEWFEKAANQGLAEAQTYVGLLYHTGQGVGLDYIKAKEWYKQACDNGDQIGCTGYKQLNDMGY